jgi:hypothetical protein
MNCFQFQILETLSHLESNPHDTIAFMAIGDFLYGRNQEDVSYYYQAFLQTILFFLAVSTAVEQCGRPTKTCWGAQFVLD